MFVLFSHEKLMQLPGAAQKTLFRYRKLYSIAAKEQTQFVFIFCWKFFAFFLYSVRRCAIRVFVLSRMLEEMAEVVYVNDRHEHVLRKLLDEVNATMSIYHIWGSHLGSSNLFRQHLESRRRITEIVEKTQVGKLKCKRSNRSVITCCCRMHIGKAPQLCILKQARAKNLEMHREVRHTAILSCLFRPCLICFHRPLNLFCFSNLSQSYYRIFFL